MNNTKKDFFNCTKLKNIWNTSVLFNGLILATVMWHEDDRWKILNSIDDWECVASRKINPLHAFRTQQDLFEYLKDNGYITK